MTEKLISFEGSPEIINELSEAAMAAGLEHTQPITTESLADPLDSPIGGEELKHIVEVLTVAFKMGTAGVGFFAALKNILKKKEGETVVVKDPATGKETGRLKAAMSEEEMKKEMGL